jgi:hypothetical protein
MGKKATADKSPELVPTSLTGPAEDNPGITSELQAPPGLSDEDLELQAALTDPMAAQAARDARKPDITWLEDAVVEAEGMKVPLFNVGDRIVIERYCRMLQGSPWLDTQTYEVQSIDDETGDLRLWNPDLKQFAMSNFIKGPARGDVFKLAPAKGSIGKKKRGRPRKHPLGAPKPEVKPGEKRGRGRPKGSKNRPKDVIKAEKARLQQERQARASRKRRVKK